MLFICSNIPFIFLQIVEARARLLQDMHSQTKPISERLWIEASRSKDDGTTIPIEENVMGPLDAVNVTSAPATLPCEEPASDSMKDIEIPSDTMEEVETEKHPVQTTEVKVVDKAVVEEGPASKNISSLTSKDATPMKYEDGDGWLEDDSGETSSARGVAIPLGQEEDVSFSDLEDVDDDQGPTRSSKTVSVDSQTTDSTGLVRPNKVSGGSVKGNNSTSPKSEEYNNWMDIEDFDVE